MPQLVNSHPCGQKSPFRKGQMMNEPNRTEWIIQYLSSHWIFVTQGRHSYSATDTSALRDFLGCQKNHGPLISVTNSPVSKLPATHVSQWNVVLLWTTRHHSWQEVLSNFPWCWDCIQQDQYPVLFAHASHLIHKTSEKRRCASYPSTISFAFFFLTSLFHTGCLTSDQSDNGFLRIYNLQNPLKRSPLAARLRRGATSKVLFFFLRRRVFFGANPVFGLKSWSHSIGWQRGTPILGYNPENQPLYDPNNHHLCWFCSGVSRMDCYIQTSSKL